MPRLPVYFLIDTSGSMTGDRFEAVKVGFGDMIEQLRLNPMANRTVALSLITFDSAVSLAMPLIPIQRAVLPNLVQPVAGASFLGAALRFCIQRINNEVIDEGAEDDRDYKPLLFILTDGKLSDFKTFIHTCYDVRELQLLDIVVCLAGGSRDLDAINALKKLTTNIVSLDNLDPGTFRDFFKWVSINVAGDEKLHGRNTTLSQLPDNVSRVQ